MARVKVEDCGPLVTGARGWRWGRGLLWVAHSLTVRVRMRVRVRGTKV